MNPPPLRNPGPVPSGRAEPAVRAAVAWIHSRWPRTPNWGLVLGTGSAAVAEAIEPEVILPYDAIPHFPRCTALGHAGQLICGTWLGQPLVALQGRWHLYEGHSAAAVTFPIRVLHALGVQQLLLSNAAGGVHPDFAVGDLMLIDDTIDLFFQRGVLPARPGRSAEAGPDRAPAVGRDSRGSWQVDRGLLAVAADIARRESIRARRGVYVGLLGPNYETAAEYRMVRQIGGDAVGMSTIPELVAAHRCGLASLAISIITNVAHPERLQKNSGEAVVAAGQAAAAHLRQVWAGVLAEAPET